MYYTHLARRLTLEPPTTPSVQWLGAGGGDGRGSLHNLEGAHRQGEHGVCELRAVVHSGAVGTVRAEETANHSAEQNRFLAQRGDTASSLSVA